MIPITTKPAVLVTARVKFNINPFHAVATPLMLVVRLEHLAKRRRVINRFVEVSYCTHIHHDEQGVVRNSFALLCPERIVGERGSWDINHKRHPSVWRERLERNGVEQHEGLAPTGVFPCSRGAAASTLITVIIITPE